MVLILKVILVVFNYQDGLIKDEELLWEVQKKFCFGKFLFFFVYFGYCFNCGIILVGFVFEFRDYMDWIEDKGLWDL